MKYTQIKPDHVLKFTKPTECYVCPLDANIYGIDFTSFKIRDLDSGKTIFHIANDPNASIKNIEPNLDDSVRFIKYDLGAEFLKLKRIGASLTFTVGNQEIPDFRMIERHYFKDKLIKSFDFKFGFCIPDSTNSWEIMYEIPKISSQLEKEMIRSPYATKSDSFYFVNDQLIMHNKAEYSYTK